MRAKFGLWAGRQKGTGNPHGFDKDTFLIGFGERDRDCRLVMLLLMMNELMREVRCALMQLGGLD